MTTCSQAHCLGTDLKAYKRYIGHGVTILCGSCYAALSAIGMSLTPVERRVTDLPVIRERRRIFRPAWLDRLRPSDKTDYAA